jgi:hypothetical protein
MHDLNADTGAAPNRGSPDGWDPNTTTLQDGAVSIDSSGFADWDETDPGHPYNWYVGSGCLPLRWSWWSSCPQSGDFLEHSKLVDLHG